MFTVADLVNVHPDLWPWMTLTGVFKVNELKIVCGVLAVRDGSMRYRPAIPRVRYPHIWHIHDPYIPIYDPYMTHIWPIYTIYDPCVTYIWPIYHLYDTYNDPYMTHIWHGVPTDKYVHHCPLNLPTTNLFCDANYQGGPPPPETPLYNFFVAPKHITGSPHLAHHTETSLRIMLVKFNRERCMLWGWGHLTPPFVG